MTTLIGISGPIASGKSTLAKGIKRIMKYRYYTAEIIPFATGLKYLGSLHDHPDRMRLANQYFLDLGYAPDIAALGTEALLDAFRRFPVEAGVKPRQLYQYIGTEIGRQLIEPDIWIKAVKLQVQRMAQKPHFILIDDMRFINESEQVDIHVGITMVTPSAQAAYKARQSLYPAEYFYSDHQSEKERDQLVAPHFMIETDFSVDAVADLVESLTEYANQLNMPVQLTDRYFAREFINYGEFYPNRIVSSGNPPSFNLKKYSKGE